MSKVVIFFAIFCVFLSAGCSRKENPAISIGQIRITAPEFEEAYQKVRSSRSPEISRKEFLDVLITRKLVFLEAETLGLDKDPQFLESLQVFWEQALLKLVLARKLNELSLISKVTEKDIETYYQRHKESDFAGKELSEVRGQIRALLFRIKEQLELQRWTASLKKNSKIYIDYDLLLIPKDK